MQAFLPLLSLIELGFMKIYTKTGDTGETSLFDGTRVKKNHGRVEAYGNVDECNAYLGQAIALLGEEFSSLKTLLLSIQRRLFHLGAILADPQKKSPKQDKESIGEVDIELLEKAIDTWDAVLPPLRAFILPGGSPAGSILHVARTVCRRAERSILDLHDKEQLPEIVIKYMNRLSDFLFVAARFVNQQVNIPEERW